MQNRSLGQQVLGHPSLARVHQGSALGHTTGANTPIYRGVVSNE